MTCNAHGVPSGIIVRQDTGGGVAPKRFLHDLTGMHARTVGRAGEEVLAVDHPVPATEVDDAEDFVLKRSSRAVTGTITTCLPMSRAEQRC